MSFGQRLAEARKNKNLTQTDLGKGLGTDGADASKAVVYGWEKGQHYPRVDQLVLICERLGEDADWLLFGRRAQNSLSPELADLAAQVDALQGKPRDWVLMTLREALKVAREIVVEQPASDNSSVRRKAA